MLNILVMEVNGDLCNIYRKALQTNGHRVHIAESLAEARSFLRKDTFDIFVCDMNMGKERGLDLIREYHAVLIGGRTVTIVVSAEEQYRAACEEAGVETFLSKPVS